MPSLADLKNILPIGAQVVGGVLNRSAAGSATNRLTSGADTAMATITGGADQARRSLADVYKHQQDTLSPFEDAGKKSLADLQAGLEPGGGLADPFKYNMDDFWADPQIQRRIAEGNKLLARKQASGGSLSSGAALKAARDYNDYQIGNEFSKERSSQEEIFRQNEADRYSRLMGVENLGQNAANKEVDAGGTYGTNLANLDVGTSRSLADLQTEKASAEAAGDIAKTNAITDTINGILKTVDNAKTAAALAPGAATAAHLGGAAALPGAASIIGGSAGTTVGAGTSLAALQAGAVPEIASSGIGLGSIPAAPGLLGTGGATGGATGGLGTAITGFLTNPITIGVGAALAGALIWKKSQAHPTASTFTKSFQDPFGQHLSKIVNGFDQAYASGQLSKAQAQQMYDETAKFIQDFEADRQAFSAKGNKEKTVADQAKATMEKNFGPNYSGILQKMQNEIAGLQ